MGMKERTVHYKMGMKKMYTIKWGWKKTVHYKMGMKKKTVHYKMGMEKRLYTIK
jgi:hypothetical protein